MRHPPFAGFVARSSIVAGLSIVVLALSSLACAPSNLHRLDRTYELPLPPNLAGRLSVGVLPFTHRVLERASRSRKKPDLELLERQDVARLETHYMAARLVEVLRDAHWFESVYVVPEMTTGVDVVVAAHIRRSDGELTDVEIEVLRLDGLEIGSRRMKINLGQSDWTPGPQDDPDDYDPTERIWIEAANQVARMVESSPELSDDALLRSRIAAYMGPGVSAPSVAEEAEVTPPPSPRSVAIIERATRIEQEKLLAPISRVMIRQAHAIQPAYLEWSQESTKLAEARRANRKQAIGMALVSMVGVAAAGFAATTDGPIAQLQYLGMQSGMAFKQAMQHRRESGKLGRAREELRAALSSEAAPLALKLEGTVHRLEGSTSQQLEMIRQIVRRELEKEASH